MALVVTDSTALIGLDRIGHLALVPTVLPAVIAPPSVIREFGEHPEWLEERGVRDENAVRAIRAHLDVGEAEAIALALEHPESLLLMDERLGDVREVRPLLDALVRVGFRASEALYRRTLLMAGEA